MSYAPISKTSVGFIESIHPEDLERPFKVILTDWFDPKHLDDIHEALLTELIEKHDAPALLKYEIGRPGNSVVIPRWTTTKQDHADWSDTDQNNRGLDIKEINAGWTGRLPVRLERWYANHTYLGKSQLLNWKPPKNLAEIIGNVARKIIPKQREIWCRWNYDLDWKAGEFMDKESCFWASRNPARQVLRENGVMALLATKSERPGSDGIGRVWVYPHTSGPMVFNAYGLPLITWVNLMATRYERVQSYISLSHSNPGNGGNDLLYVNGGRAYQMLKPGEVSAMSRYTLNFAYNEYEDCSKCNVAYFEDDLTRVGSDHRLCPSCFGKLKQHTCVKCGDKAYDILMIHYLDTEWVCRRCARFSTPTCKICARNMLFGYAKTHPNNICEVCIARSVPCETKDCQGTSYRAITYAEWITDEERKKVTKESPFSSYLDYAPRRRHIEARVCESCRSEHYREVKCLATYDYYVAAKGQPCPGCGKEHHRG